MSSDLPQEPLQGHAPIVSGWYLSVSGRVQGVGFRYFGQGLCQRLGIRGWIRNVADGTVELLVFCTETQRLLLVEGLHKGQFPGRVDGLVACPVDEEPSDDMTVEATVAVAAAWRAGARNLL